MEHSFNVEFAARYGLEAAIICRHIQFWVNKNYHEGVHRCSGRSWAYASYAGICRQLPYLKKDKVRRTIDKLIADKILLKQSGKERGAPNFFAFCEEEKWVHSYEHKPNKPPENHTGESPGKPIEKAETNRQIANNEGVGNTAHPPAKTAKRVGNSAKGVGNTAKGVGNSAHPLYKEEMYFKDKFKDNTGRKKISAEKNTAQGDMLKAARKLASFGVDNAMQIATRHGYDEIMTVIANGLAKQSSDKNFVLGPGYIINALKGEKITFSSKAKHLKDLILKKRKPVDVRRRQEELQGQVGLI